MAFGGPLQLANIFGVAHQQLDKLLLARYVALALVSPYELGLRLAMVLSSLPPMNPTLHTFGPLSWIHDTCSGTIR